ncbi:MAG TPA: GNAT family N-acetyltransferase [Accumulibacter sp.]|uniref:bifunctional acetate--CoA ligase family protein/GNAT family N-acetyltransferase n=1 Tax=Accumulibacter sp. TaxID=2053492 RepID=UPI002C3E6D1A|nr:GNAT family N-acetyltransferase [Accumulibacter sp.]HNN84779.1 GNAT family N-acetyltransferase [Accumulibacter sp.]
MTVRNLEFLFRPKSVALVAEPAEASRYADVVLANLAAGGFPGRLISLGVHRRSHFVIGDDVRLDEFATAPELAIVCASLDLVPAIIGQLGARGTRGVIVGPWLWHRMSRSQIALARQGILQAAQPWLMRVLGPGSGGLVVPAGGLNASAAPVPIKPGKIALVSQSTAIAAAVLDRAESRGIGFSTVLHLGAGLDVDLADTLDWLAADADTRSILVQIDEIVDGRKFLAAARAAARNKPVVAIHCRRLVAGGPPNGPWRADDAFQAALRRAGWVSIDTLGALFEAVEAMARVRPPRGETLTIIGNGHGLGRIAAETLLRLGGQLGELSPGTLSHLERRLQTRSPLSNPLALPPDVRPEDWAAALSAVLADSRTDSVLTVCSASPFAASDQVAAAICAVSRASERNVFTAWVGGGAMLEAQRIAAAHGVLSHDSPERAIAAFLGVLNFRRNRALLIQMPPSQAADFLPDGEAARSTLGEALAAGEETLSARRARRLLHAYGIVVAEPPAATSIDAALVAAEQIGYPVDLALLLANGAVFAETADGLRSPAKVRRAARELRRRQHAQPPAGRVSGYPLRPSAARSGTPALRLGVALDPLFGPLIFVARSAAGQAHDGDCVVALPPLNQMLALDLVKRSAFAEAVADVDERHALEAAFSQALIRLSQLLTDLDPIASVDLDPLHVEATGVVALAARIGLARSGAEIDRRRLAIRPYPKELEHLTHWHGRTLLVRPIQPEDQEALGALLNSLQPEDARMRFFNAVRSISRGRLARFTQIDYDREMALVAIERDGDGPARALGEVRAVTDSSGEFADFAIVVDSALKGQGLGRLLLERLLSYCRSRRIAELRGETLEGNLRMQRLARRLGFTLSTGADRGTIDLRLALRPPASTRDGGDR